MSAVTSRSARKLLSGLGLMASASVLSMVAAGEAQAQCAVTPVQPLNGITTDNSQVDCTGVTSGAIVVANANNVLVNVALGGTQLSTSSIQVIGNGNSVDIRNSATTADVQVLVQGNAASLSLQDSQNTNFSGAVSGADAQFRIGSGAVVTAQPGSLSIGSPAGSGSTFSLGGELSAIGTVPSVFVVAGNTGNQTFELQAGSRLTVQSNGLAFSGGGGDDLFIIQDGSLILGGTGNNILFNGGGDADAMEINGSGITNFNTTSIEKLTVDAGTGGFRALNGTNADLTEVNLLSGNTRVLDPAALGVSTSQVSVAAGASLTLAPSVQQTFNNSFAGAGQIVLGTQFNVFTFGGTANGFTGELVISQLNNALLTSDTAFGTGTITNNGQLIFGGGLNVANTISGTGAVWMTGPGQSTLSGINSYTGSTLISGGQLNVTNGSALGTGAVDIDTGALLNLDFAADGTLANDLTGVGTLRKSGNATVTLTGTNTHTGGTAITAGALRVDGFDRLGTGATTVDAGASLVLDYSGAGQLLQTTSFMSGGGAFIKEGTGDVVLDVASLFTGGTIIHGGRLGLNDGGALGTGSIQVDAGAILGIGGITLNNTITGSGSIIKTANNQSTLGGDNTGFAGLFDVQDGGVELTDGRAAGVGDLAIASGSFVFVNSLVGDTTIAADISGAGDLENFGNTRLTLTGNNSLSGVVFISNGTLQIEGSQNIGTATINIAGSAATLNLDTAGTTTLSNVVSGNGGLVKTGTGTVFVTGNNTYAGGTDIQQGAIRVTDVSFLGSGAITVQQGAALDLSIAGQQTLNQAISGAGLLRKSDVGDLTLLGNGLTGGLDVVGGRVIVSTAGAIGGGQVSLAADTQLVFDTSGTETMGNTIIGGGGLTKDGSGVLVIQNANTFTGGTLVNAGRLGLNHGQALGTGPVVVLQGAQLSIGGIALANDISGAGQVLKTSSNTGSLTGTNTYTGGTEIQGGTLVVNSPAALGTGGVSLGAGTFLNLAYSGSTNVALNNVLSGSGTLVKDGSGTVVINAANSYTGGTAINAGQLALGNGGALGTAGVTIASGAELAIGSATLANALTGAGRVVKTGSGTGLLSGNNSYSGGTLIQGGDLAVTSVNALGTGGVSTTSGTALRVGNATAQTLGLALTGAGSLVKSNTGDLTVTNNALTGGLSITAGRVLATGGSTGTGSGAVAISSGAELVYTNATDATFANGLSGAGTFRKLGAGRLLFGGPASIGSLAVDAGSVRINGTLTGNVNIASGARLDGTGQVTGTLTNNGTVAPGNSIGTLTVQGNYVHTSGSVLEIEFDGSSGIDLLAVNGTATLNGGTLRFISTTGAEGSGGTFLTATGGVTGTFATVETVGAALPLAVIYQTNSALMAPSVLTARPSTFNAQTLAGADTTLTFIDAMGLTDLRHGTGNRVWLSGLGAWGSRSATASTLAYDHDVAGLAGGVNLAVGGDVTLGAAVGWASGDITLGSNGGGGEQSSVLGALTLRHASTANSNAPRLGAGVVYGRIDQDTLRNVSFNGFSASVEGATQSDVLAAFAEAAVPLAEQGNWRFAANANGAWVHLSQDGYTEGGTSPLRLKLDDLSTSTLEAEGLLSATLNLLDGGFAAEDSPERLDLRFDLGARYLAALGDRAIPVTFAASNAGVVLQGDTRDVVQGVGGVSGSYTTRENLSVGLGYRAEIGQRDNHSVRATVSLAF
ncbi:autotransporter-associated beta strand repeat-containing protein [Alteraurantiacibacter buctensis]|uniref:Autotransporter domain-containing protein n=1 Tax=Alteraurantiacibacter buctensis TaxID=1503981 RepID=A0A844Z230_9SPHN|nr:autotransporter-associated beta strand repeat-containing protein [Alteraurantiacibacter buctensis]MXO71963.1 hypothetical protein [Alteraurantiacibacter buctensis]